MINARRHGPEQGHVLLLICVLTGLIVTGVFMCMQLLHRNSSWNVKERKNVTALQVAQAGINEAYHWLREDPERWTMLLTTPPVTLPSTYPGLPAEADVNIRISSVSVNQRRVVSTGRVRWSSNSREELQTLEALLEVNNNPAALWTAETPVLRGNVEFHWGPIYSAQDLSLFGGAATQGYPRKFARGKIFIANDDVPTDNLELFPEREDLPDMPSLDLQQYRTIALSQTDGGVPNRGSRVVVDGTPRNVYVPPANGWVKFVGLKDPQPGNPDVAFSASSDTRVRYVEGNLRIEGSSYIQGTLIVLGDLVVSGSGEGRYSTAVPADAKGEYLKVEQTSGSDPDQFPGDLGDTVNGVFKFGAPAGTDLRNGTEDTVSINGFVYAAGTVRGQGNQLIHGAAWIDPQDAGMQGNFSIFFRDDLMILISQVAPTFVIKEIKVRSALE